MSTNDLGNTAAVKSGLPSKSTQLRSAKRMSNYREDRNMNDWNNAVEIQEQGKMITENIERQRRPKGKRPPRKQKMFLDEKPSTVATPPKDELMYDGEARGSIATVSNNSHNLEFSAYIQLLDSVYESMCIKDPRLRRSLPFCAFQHYYTEILNAVLMQRALQNNRDASFAGEYEPYDIINAANVIIPAPIHDYINGIGIAVMQNGDKIHTNLPQAGIPRHRHEEPNIASGSFGPITEVNHNAYECYVSPYITRRLIEQTILANDNRQFVAWNPFPARAFPNGAVCTPNLLGYRIPERLNGDGLNVITGLHFADENTMAGRLSHSPELFARVGAVMSRYTQDFVLRIGISDPSPNAAAFIIGEVPRCNNQEVLSDIHGTMTSPEGFGSSAANQAFLFTYKRRRSAHARGPAMVINGHAPPQWNASANHNYEMQGEFAPRFGADFPFLRTNRFHEEALSGTRSDTLRQWLSRHFVRKR